jgi:hypothetical protein
MDSRALEMGPVACITLGRQTPDREVEAEP